MVRVVPSRVTAAAPSRAAAVASKSWIGAPGITDAQRDNRQHLREAMERAGFVNYPMEWWHYTLKPEPT